LIDNPDELGRVDNTQATLVIYEPLFH
jgi:hypothetical protein